MMNNAIAKIKSEMDQNKNTPYIQVIGNFLLQHLEKNPQAAAKINAVGKTISGSMAEMRKAAEKKKVGNCAVLTDQEGFDIVFKYFGIQTTETIQTAAPALSPEVDFDVSLDDLL